jgi:hypothetical protein
MGMLFRFKLRFGRNVPDILYDGILDSRLAGDKGVYPDDSRICIRNNGKARFASLDAENDFRNITTDTAPFDCRIDVNTQHRTGQQP